MLLLALLLPLAFLASSHVTAGMNITTECGTLEPSNGLLSTLTNRRSRDSTGSRPVQQAFPLDVETHIHIILAEGEREKGLVSDGMTAAQIREIQDQYMRLSINLDIVSSSVTVNTTWAQNGDDYAMKASLRRGSYAALNIYFQSQLARDPAAPSTTQFLGFSSLPDRIAQDSAQPSFIKDGCNIHAGTMPGGYVIGNNLGKTAVHEIGHWFGLLHTFWGYSCEGPGDYIDDTRQEKVATSGCPRGKNSCPGLEGEDPITNFMDYSSDECYEGFTPGQQGRMHETFALFRRGY